METIGLQVKKTVKTFPHKTAVQFQERSITFQELYDRAMAITVYLKKCGMQKGDRFGVLMSNRLEHIELDLVAAFGGYVKVPLNFRLHPKEHEYMINDAQLSILIGEKSLIDPINIDVETLFMDGDYDDKISEYLGKEFVENVDEDDLFVIMYTSGTTGNPKGGMLSHRNISSAAIALSLACEVGKNDIIGHVAPLTHGSNFLSHISWLHGNTQVVYNSFQPEEFLDDIEKDQISVIFLVPTMVNLMIQHPEFNPQKLKSVKSINMAGSPIAASKLKEAIELLGTVFVQTFGQVEAPMCITMMLRDEQMNRLESCGRPSPFIDMRIVDEDLNEVPTGEVGEIVCKGSLVMQGYWNNEAETRKTLVNGWLRTGDLGWTNEEGYLHIVDRIKEVIISGGMNIYPREIEEILSKHGGVKEVAVIGVPDDKWGEKVVAYVVPNEKETVTIEQLNSLSANYLARFKRPKEIVITDQLPKSSYGKILKRELMKLHRKVVK